MTKFENEWYNKGYDDGFSDALNSLDDDYIDAQEVTGFTIDSNKLYLYVGGRQYIIIGEGNKNE